MHSNGAFTQNSTATKALSRCYLFTSDEVHKTFFLKRFYFYNSTVLQCNTNRLQTRSKNAAFVPVFVFPAPTLKERAEQYQKANYNNNNAIIKTRTPVLSSIKRDSYLDHEIFTETPPWLSPFLSQSSHVIFKLA